MVKIAHKAYAETSRLLLKKTLDECTGKSSSKVIGEKPSRKLFIGLLMPKKDIFNENTWHERSAPHTLGFEVLIPKKSTNSAIFVEFTGSVYYRIIPTYREQKDHGSISSLKDSEVLISGDNVEAEDLIPVLGDSYVEDDEVKVTEEISINQIQEGSILRDSIKAKNQEFRLIPVFKKIELEPIRIEMKISDLIICKSPTDYQNINVDLKSLGLLRNQISKDPLIWKFNDKVKIETPSLVTEKDYALALNNLRIIKKAIPEFKLNFLYSMVEEDESSYRLKFEVINDQVEEGWGDPSIDLSIFETQLYAKIKNSEFKPFILEYFTNDFLHENKEIGLGINCTISPLNNNEITTIHAPIFEENRYKSTTRIDAPFQALADEPIQSLNHIYKQMELYYSDILKEITNFKNENEEKTIRLTEIENELKREIERFKVGIDVLTKNEEALIAFKLLNESFLNSSDKFISWRLFQLIFIVMNIPDLVSETIPKIKNYRDFVDLIYFPTGGGKTEAYLGLILFQIFFDRLRGRNFGISVIIRFPLRLLSLQQIQRISNIFGEAEKLRRTVIGRGEVFSVGYYVGARNTPNKLYSKFGSRITNNIDPINDLSNTSARNRCKLITECPFCHEHTIDLIGDLENVRIKFICKNPSCKEEIPLYISDEEIYRYLPTLIVTTLDKVAISGLNRNFRHIFNQVSGKCPDHGYLSGNRCLQKFGMCTRNDSEYIPISRSTIHPPSLFIQDELHLVRESLGAYASHYEWFLLRFSERIHPQGFQPKIIGATATISEYKNQIEQLYNKKSIAFPSQSMKKYESFYAFIDNEELARLIVGILPRGITIIFSVLKIIEAYYRIIVEFEKHPYLFVNEIQSISDEKQALDILKWYKLMLAYHLTKREGDAVSLSIENQVNESLESQGIKRINIRQLTGDVSFADVREILEILESGEEEKLDLIASTNMISHGVDINKLNFMIFRGMPRSTAEYIQALSRAGRKYPGIIFVVLNHARERDLSYYPYFAKFHEYKDVLIEPVPINRWAKFAINKTIPGIFTASLFNYFEPICQSKGVEKIYMASDFAAAFESNIITEDEIKEFILSCYVPKSSPQPEYFSDIIERNVSQFISSILSNKLKSGLSAYLSNIFPVGRGPMKSLRETDVELHVEREDKSYDPMERLGFG